MKKFIKIIGWFAGIVILVIAVFYITGNGHFINGLSKTYLVGKARPDIDDLEDNITREVKTGKPQPWVGSYKLGSLTLADSSDAYHQSFESAAFLVVHQDSIIFEKYWSDYGPQSTLNSFSMAKSFTSMAFGAAYDEKLMHSMLFPVGQYLPEYNNEQSKDLRLHHLLEMTSGIDFGESYSDPFGYMARAYYGNDLENLTFKYQVSKQPGTEWKYEGGNSVLLGSIIKRVTGKTVSDYFSEKVWQKIGAEYPAYWKVDREDGMENTFSAFYATPRDFARIGQLMLDSGKWKGEEVLSPYYFNHAIRPVRIPDANGEPVMHYGWQWWLGEYEGNPFYSARGMRGQYIAILPWLDAVMVRNGNDRDTTQLVHYTLDLRQYIRMTEDLIRQYEE